MRAIFKVISEFLQGVLRRQVEVKVKTKSKPRKEKVPEGYLPSFFNCWLCSGRTNFACKSSIIKKQLSIDCSRCGIENIVTVIVEE